MLPTEASLVSAAAKLDFNTVARMFVLGIDPGLSRCGYGAVRQDGGNRRRPVAEAAGVLCTLPDTDRAQRLAELQHDFRELIAELKPDVVAVERVLFQRNAATAMSVGEALGVVLAESAAAGCEVVEYSPNEIKQAVAGWGGAAKEEVGEMVKVLLGLKKMLRPPDAADAVAVALCHLAVVGPSVVSRRVVAAANAQ